MTDDTNIICVFTGSLVDVKYYQERLEEIGISSMFRDDFRSGTIVGIGGVPDSVELFVEIPDEEKAQKCIENLQKEE
ncbi:DUF2007 domain-containing protein [Labilibaculum sp. DW002]|jgi:putative signal transducing protein|uniref:DUF2007 domain-containing protein n=1 Tax=Paralabilibaculum antarcticum TaxID=2912572 RepID=A0ABT5VWC0_9BACT|nr:MULTISPECIES: DUF2007 domain-containing protein [unclassified Labilibaculum]MBI9058966.1 DUF2007 domain-containing protein [Labilibaculum sp.]MDE5419718.1 DUF2007 domain-containing protein [Labilibaculum sp. DW002]